MLALNPELFAAFAVATTALILMPGPIVSLVVASAIAHGPRIGLITVAGAGAGNALLVAAGALGLSAILAYLADLFDWLRWAGVAYLVYLGLRSWRAAFGRPAEAARAAGAVTPSSRGAFGVGVVVAITNPKTILFYAAFFPQFIDPELAAGPQLAAMSIAFVAIAIFFDGCYAMLAGRIAPWLEDARRARIRNGITGTLLIATGLGLALARRNS